MHTTRASSPDKEVKSFINIQTNKHEALNFNFFDTTITYNRLVDRQAALRSESPPAARNQESSDDDGQ